MTRTLYLYYRPGCSLCEEMHRELLECNSGGDFELELIDIDGNEALVSRYGHKIPVLADSGDYEICHFFLDRQALSAYFATH